MKLYQHTRSKGPKHYRDPITHHHRLVEEVELQQWNKHMTPEEIREYALGPSITNVEPDFEEVVIPPPSKRMPKPEKVADELLDTL